MSKDDPTPQEEDAILAYQNGTYEVELPDWYTTPSDYKPVSTKVLRSTV